MDDKTRRLHEAHAREVEEARKAGITPGKHRPVHDDAITEAAARLQDRAKFTVQLEDVCLCLRASKPVPPVDSEAQYAGKLVTHQIELCFWNVLVRVVADTLVAKPGDDTTSSQWTARRWFFDMCAYNGPRLAQEQ